MHFLSFLMCALTLGSVNLERTVADEKPSGDYLFNPVLTFGDRFDKQPVFEKTVTENLQEKTQNLAETEGSISTSLLISKIAEQQEELSQVKENKEVKTSVDADADDDEVCHNETSYSSLAYIAQVMMKSNVIEQLLEDSQEVGVDTRTPQLLNNIMHAPPEKGSSTDAEKSDSGDLLTKLLLSAIVEPKMKSTDHQEEDLATEIVTESKNEESQYTTSNYNNPNGDEAPRTEDIGKLLREADLFDYPLFAEAYLQQVVECSVATVNVTKLTDLPSGIFEAINVVHNDLVNKLNLN